MALRRKRGWTGAKSSDLASEFRLRMEHPYLGRATLRDEALEFQGETQLAATLERLLQGWADDVTGLAVEIGSDLEPNVSLPVRFERIGGAIELTFTDGSKTQIRRSASRLANSRSVWKPTSAGPLNERDLSEVSRLAEHLGRWVENLADDDARLLTAEATRDQLISELRLPEPRRLMLRACIQSALDLLRSDVEAFTRQLAEVLDVDLDAHAQLDQSGAPSEEAWASASAVVTQLAERAAADFSADELPAGPVASDGRPSEPGRGTLLLKWVTREGAAGVVRNAAWGVSVAASGWLTANGSSGVARVIEALLNLIGL